MTDPVTEQQIDQWERELDYWMARAYEAEKRAWKAETRLAGWMEHWNATARTGSVDEVAAILEANTRADHAEARIKAVRDVLAHHPYGGPEQEDAIRRALEGLGHETSTRDHRPREARTGTGGIVRR